MRGSDAAHFCVLDLVLQLPKLPCEHLTQGGLTALKTLSTLVFLSFLFIPTAAAQTVAIPPAAEQTIQPSQSPAADSNAGQKPREVKLPAGTPIEIQVAYTVNSLDLKPGERISFRVLVPIMIDGLTVIENGALVTARIIQSKRGGHWGKAGKLAWTMEDVIAVDNSRVVLAPETATRNDKLWNLEKTKQSANEVKMGQGRVSGTSHAGEVAVMSVVSGALFPPLALLHGFKRGENAVLREGRRFVVAVARDTNVKVTKVADSR
jgi:hypothetical protein